MRAIMRGLAMYLLGGLCIIGASEAEARGSAATAGTPGYRTETTCFDRYSGGVVNRCSTAANWVLPATFDNAGGMTFQVAAKGVSGTARIVSCEAWSVDSAGGYARRSGVARTVRNDGVVEYLQMSVSAHGWGSAYVYCTMDPGTVILNYHY